MAEVYRVAVAYRWAPARPPELITICLPAALFRARARLIPGAQCSSGQRRSMPMSTWELDPPASASRRDPRVRPRERRNRDPFAEYWRAFNDRRGTGTHSFGQRLSRARLLYLRRDENGANWLALSVLAAALSLPSLFPRVISHPTEFCGGDALPAGDTSRCAANLVTHLQSIPEQVKNVRPV
jgi:hypothetical protein